MTNSLKYIFSILSIVVVTKVSAIDNGGLLNLVKQIGEQKYQHNCAKVDWDTILLRVFREFVNADSNQYVALPQFTTKPGEKSYCYPKLVLRNGYLNIAENDYDTLGNFPPAEYRLLAFSNCWNILRFFHPYKELFKDNWDSVFYRYLPLIVLSNNAVNYHKTMMRFIAGINDSHGYFLSPLTDSVLGKYFCPFSTRFINDSLVITNIYRNAFDDSLKIQPGDVVVAIDGKTMSERVAETDDLLSASNEAALKRNIAHYILAGDSLFVELMLLRDSRLYKIRVRRYILQQLAPTHKSVKVGILNECADIGYFNLVKGSKRELLYFLKHIDSKKIIFDLRGADNSGLLEVISKRHSGKKILVGHTEFTGYSTIAKVYCGIPERLKIDSAIVLVNEYTQSSSEYLAFLLQSVFHCKLVGTQTAGALQDVLFVKLPGNISVSFTRSKFVPVQTNEIYRQGLQIDKEVVETVADVVAGKDAYISTAYKFICQ